MARVSGGDKADAALKQIAELLGKGNILEVGFFEGKTYPDGTSVPEVAAYNEYGVASRKQPPRPFFRNMIADKSGKWPEAISKLLVKNKYNVKMTMEQVGLAIQGQLKDSIRTLTSPPLAQSTIDRKGHDKPLIDTELMLDSVEYKVTSSKGE